MRLDSRKMAMTLNMIGTKDMKCNHGKYGYIDHEKSIFPNLVHLKKKSSHFSTFDPENFPKQYIWKKIISQFITFKGYKRPHRRGKTRWKIKKKRIG